MKIQPLISCLCVTRNNVELLARAIACFKFQTYENKELILIYEDDDLETINFVNDITDSDIITFEISASPKLSLGSLRNISIEKSNGEYLCQWDDDDWYHPDRILVQINAIEENMKPASILVFWLMYDQQSKQSYLSYPRGWEGSIMCKKSEMMSIGYCDKVRGEDDLIIEELIDQNKIHPIVNARLYIYTYNSRNTWDYAHFENLYEDSQLLSVAVSEMIDNILRGRYSVEESLTSLNSELILKELNYMKWAGKSLLKP